VLLPEQVLHRSFFRFSIVLIDRLLDLMSTYIAHSTPQVVQLSRCSGQV